MGSALRHLPRRVWMRPGKSIMVRSGWSGPEISTSIGRSSMLNPATSLVCTSRMQSSSFSPSWTALICCCLPCGIDRLPSLRHKQGAG